MAGSGNVYGCQKEEENDLLSKMSDLPWTPREALLADALVQVGRVHAIFSLPVALVVPVQALIFWRTREEVPLRAAAALDEVRLLQMRTRRAAGNVAPPARGGRTLGAEPAATFAVQRAPSTTYPSLGQTPPTRLKGRAADGQFIHRSIKLYNFRPGK